MRAVVHEEYRRRAEDHWWFRARRAIFGELLADLPLPRPARVLDLGPGSGVNLPILAPLGPVTVVDVDATSLHVCREAGAARVIQADAARLPFAAASHDLVCALDVIEHLHDDAGALRECRRVLRPDGRLLLSVPAHRWLWGRQDVLSAHRRRYARGLLRQRLGEAELHVERLTYFNALLLPPIAAVRLSMRPFLRWTRHGGSDLAFPLPRPVERLLHGVFAMERHWLRRRDLPLGVSLLAIARPAP